MGLRWSTVELTPFSSECCWIRSTPCPTELLMPLSSTFWDSGMKRESCPCYGISVGSLSPRDINRTSAQTRSRLCYIFVRSSRTTVSHRKPDASWSIVGVGMRKCRNLQLQLWKPSPNCQGPQLGYRTINGTKFTQLRNLSTCLSEE